MNYIFIYGGKKTINYPYCRKILFFKQHKLDTFIRKKIINLREKNIFSFVKEGEIISSDSKFRYLEHNLIFYC